MSGLRIMLGDLRYVNEFSRSVLATPLNIGYIAAYCREKFGKEVTISLYSDPAKMVEDAVSLKPHIVGLSLYFWNLDLDRVVIERIKSVLGSQVAIVGGGPSIDDTPSEQTELFQRLPGLDALVPLEGELGFGNIVEHFLSQSDAHWDNPLDGVVFRRGEELVQGAQIGLSLDLSQLPSPYLTGLLDPFLEPQVRPMIQSSRGCPYSCIFCTSGKTKPSLRKFPIDQVKDELSIIAKKYSGNSHVMLILTDQNFGLFPRDVEIAEHINKLSRDSGYPMSVYFYSDKKLPETSFKILNEIGHMNIMGLSMALQSQNPDTLKAVRRHNIGSQRLKEAIEWAGKKNIFTSTELIFGLPYETKASFIQLMEEAAEMGFDELLGYNLFLMPGIELYRQEYRDQFGFKTKWRIQGPNYGEIGGAFALETQEVVVGSSTFGYDDFLAVRSMAFMFYCVSSLRFYNWFFQGLRSFGIPWTSFFESFLDPPGDGSWPPEYLQFVQDLKKAFEDELFDNPEECREHVRRHYMQAGGKVVAPSRVNLIFGARLIYLERKWVNSVMERIMRQQLSERTEGKNGYAGEALHELLALSALDRIDLKQPSLPDSFEAYHDLLGWRSTKFRSPIAEYRCTMPRTLHFEIEPAALAQIKSFHEEFKECDDVGYYCNGLDMIRPRSNLMFGLREA